MNRKGTIRMVNLTLNLYNNNEIDEQLIKSNILMRNPVIFFIDEHTGTPIYNVLNLCRTYGKNILTLNRFDLDRAFSYLYSFSNLNDKRILFMAPASRKAPATKYAQQLIVLLNQTCT